MTTIENNGRAYCFGRFCQFLNFRPEYSLWWQLDHEASSHARPENATVWVLQDRLHRFRIGHCNRYIEARLVFVSSHPINKHNHFGMSSKFLPLSYVLTQASATFVSSI